MHKLHIENFGPIKKCEFTVDDFCVLTGAQASGKSTIAKVIFYFRTVADEIVMSFLKYFHMHSELSLPFEEFLQENCERSLLRYLMVYGK